MVPDDRVDVFEGWVGAMLRRGRKDGGSPVDGQRVAGLVMVGAVAVAPLLGLLYGLEIGLVVLVLALVVTITAAIRSMPMAPVEARGRLRLLLGLNLAILVAAVGAIVALVV